VWLDRTEEDIIASQIEPDSFSGEDFLDVQVNINDELRGGSFEFVFINCTLRRRPTALEAEAEQVQVAVKVLKVLPGGAAIAAGLALRREVDALKALSVQGHPHLVRYFGVTLFDERVGLVLEQCNSDLSTMLVLQKLRPLPADDAGCARAGLHAQKRLPA